MRILLPMLFFTAAAVMPADAQPKALSVEECVHLGLQNSNTLHSSMMKSLYADAKSSEASASLFPSLKLQAGYSRLSSVPAFSFSLLGNTVSFPVILNNYSARLSLQQPLFTGWRLQSVVDNAEYGANAAHEDFDRDKSQLIYDIKAAYWNLYRAKEVSRLADENVQQISLHLTDIENMFNQGVATTNDVLKVKVQLSNARLLQSDAHKSVVVATMSLNLITGQPLDGELSLTSTLTSTTKEFPAVKALVQQAMADRPEVKSTQWRVKAAESGVTAAHGSWFPQIALTGNYYYSRPNQRIFPAVDAFKDSWDVGITFQLDLWNNLTSVHQSDAASAQYQQMKDAEASLRDAITLEVTRSYLDFQEAREKIQLSELAVEQADENLRVNQDKFRTGLSTNTDLLDAELASLQAKIQHTQALVEFELAEAMLEKAAGGAGQ